MNRKQRKARLKRLNAVKKAHNKIPLTDGFRHKVDWASNNELQRMLDELYLVFTWESDKPKIRERIDLIEKVIHIRMDKKFWKQVKKAPTTYRSPYAVS